MNLFDFFKKDMIEYRDDLKNREDVFRRIASMVAGNTGDITEEALFKALAAREKLGSTGLGFGVAIPHCRMNNLSDFIVGMLISSRDINFDSGDGEPVRIIPFVVGPESKPKEFLKILSCLVQMLRDPEVRKKIATSKSPDEVYEFLKHHAEPTGSEPRRSPGRKLVHVFIQNEEFFDDILQIFTGLESISTVIVESRDPMDFLMKSPFFAGLWTGEGQRFSRIIISVVKNELVNSIVRNIEYVCGSLSERDDVLVTVTDIHYTLGSLS